MKRWTLTAVCTAAVLGLAACGTTNTAGNASAPTQETATGMHTSTNATLQAYHWYLDKAEDAGGKAQPLFKSLEPKAPVRLDFNAGKQIGRAHV